MTNDVINETTATIAVLGTGRYGSALTKRLVASGYRVRLGSRTPSDGQYHLTAAVESASIVFLCVPLFAHESILSSLSPILKPDTILVDVSNHELHCPPSPGDISIAEHLATIVPHGVIVAKALNTLPAHTLERDPLLTVVPPPARIACDDAHAAMRLGDVFRTCLLTPMTVGPLVRARHLEVQAHRQFPSWHISMYMAFFIFVFWLIYYSLYRYVALVPPSNGEDGMSPTPIKADASELPMKMLVHVMAETAMTLFSITFIAGPIAKIIDLVRHQNGSKPLWPWLSTWLNMRKELGLIAFSFSVPHSLAGLTVPGAIQKLDANFFYAFGILSSALFIVVSVSSLPSVVAELSWREATSIFSWLGSLAYLLGAIHHILFACRMDGRDPRKYPLLFGVPMLPTGWLGFIIVAVTSALRVVLWNPISHCSVRRLQLNRRDYSAV